MYWKNKSKWIWIFLGVTSIIIRMLLSFSPELTERFYSRGFFIGIRYLVDYTIGWLPIPFSAILIGGLLFYLLKKVKNLKNTHVSWRHSLGRVAFSLVSFLCAVVFLFLVLWGYNYGRVSVEDNLGFTPKPLEMEEVKTELDLLKTELELSRSQIPNITDAAIDASFLPEKIEQEVRQIIVDLLEKIDYPTPGVVRGRLLRPKGVLLRFSTAGVYLPWTGESNVDGGLHPIQIPFTLAHEFAHGYGFTDEGTCNFIAYLACIQADNKLFQYSGQLGYWRYLASSYRRYDRKAFKEYFESLPKGMIADVIAIDENTDKYPDIMPRLRDAAYDTYLKTQGIKEGMKNYSRVVMLVKGWKEKELSK